MIRPAVPPAEAHPCIDENLALELMDGLAAPPVRLAALQHAEGCDECRALLKELAAQAPSGDTPSHAGEWELLGEIGRGASGTVHRARHRRLGLTAAVKLLSDPQLRARFDREARALASLADPGIVRYYEHGTIDGGSMYLAMQWVEGITLEERLERGPVLEPTEVVQLGAQLARALDHAHQRGCVHRDLSPRNVLLENGDLRRAIIVDFGLVRWVGPNLVQTLSQAIVGTPYFMSPEQIKGEFDIDARTDLFTLGVLLYLAASGQRPFQGNDLLTLWQRIVHSAPPDLARLVPTLPRGLVDIIHHLLEKAPADRPVSAAQVAQALARVSFDPEPPPATVSRRWLWGSALLTALTVALSAWAMIAYHSARSGVIWIETGSAGDSDDDTEEHAPQTSEPRPLEPRTLDPRTPPTPTRADEPLPITADAATDAATPATRRFTCMGHRQTRGGRYFSPEEGVAAVTVVNGRCTLEDCVIEGSRAITVLQGNLTLRRCAIRGEVLMMNPNTTLTLEHSDLTESPHSMSGAVLTSTQGATTTYRVTSDE